MSLSIFQLICLALKAQVPAVIKGYVKDSTGISLSYTNVKLLSFPDSSVIAADETDKDGFYLLSASAGSYFLSIERTTYNRLIRGPYLLKSGDTLQAPLVMLQKRTVLLNQVTVEAPVQFEESSRGYSVLNMEATHSAAGSNAYDILKKAPGITIDADGSISMRGRNSVAISIDNKPVLLSGNDLSEYLRGISGDMIRELELISNPSSEHEAAGTGGLINIKLKKMRRDGTHADISVGTGYGERFKQNYALIANHRKGKVNLFGAWSYNNNRRLERYSFERNVRFGSANTNFNLLNKDEKTYHNHSVNAGVDYLIKEGHSIGLMYSATRNRMRSEEDNMTSILEPGRVDSSVIIRSDELRRVKSNVFNLNYRSDLGAAGSLVVDADYFNYNRRSEEALAYNFFNQGRPYYPQSELFANSTPASFNIRSIRVDYTKSFDSDSKILAGFKLSKVAGDNRREIGGNTWISRLAGATNDEFEFDEDIYAGYITYHRQFKPLKLETGLRAEQTHTHTKSLTGEQTERNYVDLFPFLSISGKLDQQNKLMLVYSTRINRPAYDDLNPFIYFLDQYTYRQGNPYLKPEYANTLEISNVYKEKLTIGISATYVKDYYLTITQQNDSTGVSKSMKQNLSDQKGIGLEVLYSLNINNLLYSSFHAQGYYRKFSFAGTNAVSRSSPYFVFSNNTSWKLNKGYSAELSFNYESATTSGMFDFDAVYALNAGLGKSLLAKKVQLRLYVSDIFNSERSRYHSNVLNTDLSGRSKMETRIVRLSATCKLGGQGGTGRQNRATGNEQERRRLGN